MTEHLQRFDTMPDGQAVDMVRLRSERVSVNILTLGASVQDLRFEDAPMVLSGNSCADYLGHTKFFGAIVGRVANRIDQAKAILDGKVLSLNANESNGNCLHGGSDGSGVRLWSIAECFDSHAVFTLHLPDGHMGFPGALNVQAHYTLQGTALGLEITATSDALTLCSFAPHSYWNLSGEANIDAHRLQIAAPQYLPVNERQIPTGAVEPVDGTKFDFTPARAIAGTEMDHNFCLSPTRRPIRPIAWLHSAASGVTLEVATTEPGLQIYDGRHMGRAGLALEPQVWPDAANQPGFPTMLLRPEDTYRAVSEFKLSKRTHA